MRKTVLIIVATLFTLAPLLAPAETALAAAAAPITVSGNHLTANGSAVQLRGVNETGTEYACAEGWGIFDEPFDSASNFASLHAWHVNAVRIPLNEDCWLGINGVKSAYGSYNYRKAIVKFADDLVNNGFWPIINLHFSAPGTKLADGQAPMADESHSPAFWYSVAHRFASDPLNGSMVFDLFNEPYPDSNRDSTAAWTCVLKGGTCPGVSFQAAGMQQLVGKFRSAGNSQPLMIAGPQYAGVLDHWLAYEPSDPAHHLAASIHIYGLPLDSPCRTTYNTCVAQADGSVPVVTGEFGDTNCTDGFSGPFMNAMDKDGVSYIAWAWTASGGCGSEPALLSNFGSATPTAYGTGIRSHYQSLP